MSDKSASAKVLTPFEKRIAQLILEGYNRADVATVLRISADSLKVRISLMYRKLAIKDDGIHDRRIMFLRLIHERRAAFEIMCKECDSPCDLGAKCRACAGPCDRGLSCKAFWSDIGP